MKKPLPALTPQNVDTHRRMRYFVEVPSGTTVDDLLDPGTWLHTKTLRRHDLLEIVTVDGEMSCLLRVLQVSGGMPLLACMWSWKAETAEFSAPSDSGLRVEFSPARPGWVVVIDGAPLPETYASQAEAEAALAAREAAE